MKIKEALVADLFIQRFTDQSITLQQLEQYAKEELELPAHLSKKFATEATNGQPTDWLNTLEDYNRFFTWYYINHASNVISKN
jgi:hypothetical protein